MDTEEWGDVDNYDGLYQVSTLGNVRRVYVKHNTVYTVLKKPYVNGKGYVVVSLWKDNKGKTFKVHRLFAKTFIPNPNSYKEVNHIDGCKNYGESTFNQIITIYKSNAKSRGYEFLLTREQVKSIVFQDCYYCGSAPSQTIVSKSGNGDTIYNGIDRLDNTKGYTIDNCVPCCGVCNTIKSDLTLQQLKDWLKKVTSHQCETHW